MINKDRNYSNAYRPGVKETLRRDDIIFLMYLSEMRTRPQFKKITTLKRFDEKYFPLVTL